MADMNSIKTVINQLDEIVETMKIRASGNRDEVDNLTMCVNTLKAWGGMNVEAGKNTLPIQRVTAPLLNYSFRDENSELQHCQVDIRNAETMLGNMMTKLNEVNRFIAEFTSNGR